MSMRIVQNKSAAVPLMTLPMTERRSSGVQDSPLRVFLVEDSPLLRDTFTEAATVPGHIEVVGYADSEGDAVEGINRCLPDVVIVDICLRDGNGLSLLRSLSQMIWIRLPVLIVLTNHADPEYAKACRALGADYFFDKSTEFEEAVDVLGLLAGQ